MNRRLLITALLGALVSGTVYVLLEVWFDGTAIWSRGALNAAGWFVGWFAAGWWLQRRP